MSIYAITIITLKMRLPRDKTLSLRKRERRDYKGRIHENYEKWTLWWIYSGKFEIKIFNHDG